MEAPMMWPGRMPGVTGRPDSPGSGHGDTHVVGDGETLGDIAEQHGTTPEAIRGINPQIRDGGRLTAGDSINLPPQANGNANGHGNGNGNGNGIGNGNGNGMPGTNGQGYGMPGQATASLPGGGLLPLLDNLVSRVLPMPSVPAGSGPPTTWLSPPSTNPLPTPTPIPHDGPPGLGISHGGDIVHADGPRWTDPPPTQAIGSDPSGSAEPLPSARYDAPPNAPSQVPPSNVPTAPNPDPRGTTQANSAPPSPPTAQNAPGTAQSATTAGTPAAPQAAAAQLAADKAQLLLARGDAAALPKTALAQTTTATSVLLAQQQAAPGRADVPVLARSLAESALLAATPGKETAQTASTPRDAQKLAESEMPRAQPQTPGNAENAARDPAKLLRDVQARMLSDARPSAETQQRSPASTDPLFRRSDKNVANAPSSPGAEETAKARGTAEAERDARIASKRSGDALWTMDWVGQLARLRWPRSERIDEGPDLLAAAAVLGVGVVLLAGVFALYALYRYWAPH